MSSKRIAIAAVGLVLLVGAGGCAHDTQSTQSNVADHYQYVTGSYLPQDVEKTGSVTSGDGNLRIIDQSDIERSGGADVRDTLRRLGANR